MKALVIYDSQYGNTERVARAMADTLSEYGEAQAVRVGQLAPADFRRLDLLILGCPIQGWKPSKGMQSFLEGLHPQDLQRLNTAAFDTRVKIPRFLRGKGAEIVAARLEELGSKPIVEPAGFLVKGTEGPLRDGELERAMSWARTIAEKCEASQARPDSVSYQPSHA